MQFSLVAQPLPMMQTYLLTALDWDTKFFKLVRPFYRSY